jgi:hypothetical protein
MNEQMTLLDRWKEMAIIENARMHRRMIGRDDMHAYMHKPWPIEHVRRAIEACLEKHGELSIGDLCSMIKQDVSHIDVGVKSMKERKTIVRTGKIEGQTLYRLRLKGEFI